MYAGNDIPLVSRWTGNLGLSWDVYQKLAVFEAVVRYVGERRMDNDQANFQPLNSGAHNGRYPARRRIPEFLLVGFGAEFVQRIVLRLRGREFRDV